jgi:6-phosphofructo-2-kinase/fructose-2,6-biphosphatase 2
LRCLYAYFLALPQEELPYIKIPLHTLIKITPMAYGCHEERYPLPIAAVDTHRAKPSRKRVGSVGAADATPVDSDAPRAPPARDYFGDVSQHLSTQAKEDGGAKDKPALNAVEAVQAALERDADQGLLTPKAVKGP